MSGTSEFQRDDALLSELTGAPQRWLALCRAAVAHGPDATRGLLELRRETGVLARHSLARWKRLDADDDPLEEESENPDLEGERVTADVSAAHALAALARALTGALDIAAACEVFLRHTERAGLHSAGTQLLPAGPITGGEDPVAEMVLHLLGQGGRPSRGYAILTALELAGRRPPTVRTTRVSVLFVDIGGAGRVGVLRLEQLREGPSGLHPDPSAMSFLQADRDFTDSLARAWEVSRPAATNACVLWSVTGVGRAPENDINGASMAAAMAVALDDLAPRHQMVRWLRVRRLDPACAVTAGLSNTELTTVGGYAGKLAAAQRASLRVVVAETGFDEARRQAPEDYLDRVAAAATVSEAVSRTRSRPNLALWLVSVAGMLAVLSAVVSVTGLNGVRAENAAARAESNSRLFAGVARGGADFDPALAQLVAVAAVRTSDTVDARSALLEFSALGTPIRIRPGTTGDKVSAGADAPRLATSLGGDLIAIGGDDGFVQLVRVGDAGVTRMPPFPAMTGPVRALAVSTDQRWLAVAGERSVLLWDIAENPSRTTEFALAEHLPWSLAFAPGSDLLAIGTHGGTVLSWRLGADPAHPVPLPAVTVPGNHAFVAVHDRVLVAAGARIVGGTWTTTVRGWHTADPHRPAFDVRVDRSGGAEIRSVDFDGDMLAVGLNPGEIARWRIGADLTRPEPLPGTARGANEYFDVALVGDGRAAVAVGGDARARLLDLDTGAVLARFPGGSVARTEVFRGGRALVTSGFDGAVHVFDLASPSAELGQRTLFRLPQDRSVPSPGVLPDALLPRLRALSRAGALDNLADGDPSGLFDTVVIGPDGTRAATLNERGIQVWDLSESTPTPFGRPIDQSLVDTRGVVFAPDGTLAVGRGLTSSVELWDLTRPGGPELRSTLRFGHGYPTALALSPDGSRLAVGSHRTGHVTVFDLRAHGTPSVAELSGLPTAGQDMSLAVTAHDTLAVGTRAGAFVYRLGEPGGPRPLPIPVTARGPVGSVAFDHTGTRLAVDDRTHGRIDLWDYTDPAAPTVYATLDRRARHWQKTMLAFAGAGTVLVESATDGTVRRWRTDAATEAARICASGTAPITRPEWSHTLPGRAFVEACPFG
ncbi:WD40 repeat domain-containing protein [Nocardia caishijiensis]|uniref:WD40 repeat protein n=1 Tax=Nocardia caishijiensis TaxID=184756 RepID=A0ABQ6YMS2_9NOCA|nr:WD40 repeat domain-containing protein [Nocardia caishijiensis]KAF0847074.1 WD40 repeat protein [Nocardia caishijiensis]